MRGVYRRGFLRRRFVVAEPGAGLGGVPFGGLEVDGHVLVLDGARLAVGSTTGSLWVSDDAGDRWACVNANLPPIHAVRWM